MRSLSIVAVATLLVLAVPAPADENAAIVQAQTAANSWLALTDGAKFGPSWDAAASLFKAAVTKDQWEKALAGVRSPLGAVKARRVKTATFSRTLPGAPAGEYVVIQFESRFENKASATETVTPMKDKDGTWRVSGHYIK